MELINHVLCLCVCVTFVNSKTDPDLKWRQFKKKFGKDYEDLSEAVLRRSLYLNNLKIINEWNREADLGRVSVRLAPNQFSDRTAEERKRSNKIKLPWNPTLGSNITSFQASPVFPNAKAVPSSVDLRKDACIAPIKDEGNCVGSYAFSAMVGVEYTACKQYFNEELEIYSEQRVIDCTFRHGNYGCQGGFYDTVWSFLKRRGTQLRSDYPYRGKVKLCRRRKRMGIVRVDKIHLLFNTLNEEDMMNAVANVGPLAVAVDSRRRAFQFYSSGIYNGIGCANYKSNKKDYVDHTMAIVGYGTENGVDYWILRNSWGPYWGINGYMYMVRGNNTCNVALYPAYATLRP